MKKSIAIVGQGFVGGSLTTVMNERNIDVYTYDITGRQALGGKHPIQKLVPPAMIASSATQAQIDAQSEWVSVPAVSIADLVQNCESKQGFSKIYFVCLPTPMEEDGSADLSIVEGVLKQLASVPGERIAVVKSTVPPGSTERWNRVFNEQELFVVFNPEFLTEANALDDMRNQNRIVLGGPRPHINKVKQLFEAAFPQVPIIKTSSTTAEMVKYVTNIHLAVKVSLANEFYQICEALDEQGANIDYDKVIEYATLDERLGKSHWKVPGPMPADDTGEPAFGWAGSCFVKDLNALMHTARALGIDPKTMEGAWQKNLEVRPQRDWEKLVGRAISKKS